MNKRQSGSFENNLKFKGSFTIQQTQAMATRTTLTRLWQAQVAASFFTVQPAMYVVEL
jgi:hypothetical protein